MISIIIMLSFILNFVTCMPEYILTNKLNGKSSINKIQKHKFKGSAKIGDVEYVFASGLSSNEINYLSNEFYVEHNDNATINWHLDRVDQKYLPLSNTEYKMSVTNNSNIDIYIIDTGIDILHEEFSNNNIIWGANFVDNINSDCNGHGTHVASLAAGKIYGAAKNANLIAVKVLGCSGSGSYDGIISAIEWIINRSKTSGKISVINMSLGGSTSVALDTAMKSAYAQGVYMVVAAGNSNANACNYSPARVAEAVTVAASSSNDYKASFSNFGKCVDVYAPGVSVIAAWPNNQYAVLSGTSMASPVACGVLSTYLSKYGRSGYNMFFSNMTANVIKQNPRTTPNKMVYI